MQGKAIPSFVRQKIIESWLEWKGPCQIGQELRLPKQIIAKIVVDIFVPGGNIEEILLGQCVLNDVNNYMECCKTTNPSIYSSEI